MISLLGDPTARAWYRMLAGLLLIVAGGCLAFHEFALNHFSERTTGVVTERTRKVGRGVVYRIKYEYRTPGGAVTKDSARIDLMTWHRSPPGGEVEVDYFPLLPRLVSRPASVSAHRIGRLVYFFAALLAGAGGFIGYTGYTRARAALAER
jgi:hypothetical protein